MPKKVVVIGGGGHARSVISVLKKIDTFHIAGYIDREDRGDIFGVPYLGGDDSLPGVISSGQASQAVIGLGSVHVDRKRQEIYDKACALGFQFPAVISPTATINDGVEVCAGAVVLDRAVLNTGTRIGAGSIVNTGAIVDHDGNIGAFVHIAPGAVLSGGVTVGSFSLIGTGAVIIQNCTIGEECVVGAGATVVNDRLKKGVHVGTPAVWKKGIDG